MEHNGFTNDRLHLRPDSPPIMDHEPDFNINHSDKNDVAERMMTLHISRSSMEGPLI